MAKIQTSDQPAEARYFPDGLVLSLCLSVQAELQQYYFLSLAGFKPV